MDLEKCIHYCRQIISHSEDMIAIQYARYIRDFLLALKQDFSLGYAQHIPVIFLPSKEL